MIVAVVVVDPQRSPLAFGSNLWSENHRRSVPSVAHIKWRVNARMSSKVMGGGKRLPFHRDLPCHFSRAGSPLLAIGPRASDAVSNVPFFEPADLKVVLSLRGGTSSHHSNGEPATLSKVDQESTRNNHPKQRAPPVHMKLDPTP